MDNSCNTDNSLGAWTGQQLHHGRIHSSTAGYRNCCGVDKNNSGTKTSGIKAGKVDAKEVRMRKDSFGYGEEVKTTRSVKEV